MKLRLILFITLITFAVTLAVVIGVRLSDQAMAVVVGVIAGVAASIPTSLIVVWLATRHMLLMNDLRRHGREPEPDREATPRVVIVQSPSPAPPPFTPGYPTLAPHMAPPPARRQFTIIGGDDDPDGVSS